MVKRVIFFNLETEMLRAGITRAKLAKILNLSPVTVSSKFNGKTEFTLKEMNQIRYELEKINGSAYGLDYLFLK